MESESKPNYRRLYRSPDDRVIAGVCGGLGEYFTTDPVILRLILVVLVLFGGSGLVLYLLAWILIPRRPWDMKI